MKALINTILVCFLISGVCSASPTTSGKPFTLKHPYVSGLGLCSGAVGSMNDGEYGRFVPVPASYESSTTDMTNVYAWTFKPFDPDKPTAIVFGGGPGESLHEGPSMLEYFPANWNIVFFDSRGMFCSRPQNSDLLQDYRFVSSEYIARDAQKVAEFLKIKTWTAFGASYGTVAATIAGHLFPSAVRSVVLQGTIFKTDKSDADLIPIAQKIFDQLPSAQRSKIISISARTDIEMIEKWAFSFIFLGSYGNDLVTKRFAKLFTKSDEEILNEVRELLSEIEDDGYEYMDDETNSSWLKTVLTCRERSDLRIEVQFRHGKFSSSSVKPDYEKIKFCRQFGIPFHAYNAENYRLKVPVTYLQGKLDMATPFRDARRHFYAVARSKAQFIYAPKGGHMLMNPSDFGNTYYELLDTAFSGKRISSRLLDKSNRESKLKLQAIATW